MRVNLIMPDELVASLDNAAKALNISRTAYICMAVSQKIQQDNMMAALPDMLELMKIAQSNSVSFPSLKGGGNENIFKGDLTDEGQKKR